MREGVESIGRFVVSGCDSGSGKWNASLAAKAIKFFPAGGKKAIPYESICSMWSNPRVMWSEVTIESSKGSVVSVLS